MAAQSLSERTNSRSEEAERQNGGKQDTTQDYSKRPGPIR